MGSEIKFTGWQRTFLIKRKDTRCGVIQYSVSSAGKAVSGVHCRLWCKLGSQKVVAQSNMSSGSKLVISKEFIPGMPRDSVHRPQIYIPFSFKRKAIQKMHLDKMALW